MKLLVVYLEGHWELKQLVQYNPKTQAEQLLLLVVWKRLGQD